MSSRSVARAVIDGVLCEPPLNIRLVANRLRAGDFVPQRLAEINGPCSLTARTFIRQHARCLLAIEGYRRHSPTKCVLVILGSVVGIGAERT